jgi:hypothetical protein
MEGVVEMKMCSINMPICIHLHVHGTFEGHQNVFKRGGQKF